MDTDKSQDDCIAKPSDTASWGHIDSPATAYKRGFEEGRKHAHAHAEARHTFGTVLIGLKDGSRFAREGWNGKGMYIYYVQGRVLHAINNPDLPLFGVKGQSLYMLPFIMMRTVRGELVPWLASQTDILAEDWIEVRS